MDQNDWRPCATTPVMHAPRTDQRKASLDCVVQLASVTDLPEKLTSRGRRDRFELQVESHVAAWARFAAMARACDVLKQYY